MSTYVHTEHVHMGLVRTLNMIWCVVEVVVSIERTVRLAVGWTEYTGACTPERTYGSSWDWGHSDRI
jgi:hypothetical protein